MAAPSQPVELVRRLVLFWTCPIAYTSTYACSVPTSDYSTHFVPVLCVCVCCSICGMTIRFDARLIMLTLLVFSHDNIVHTKVWWCTTETARSRMLFTP